MSRFLYTLGWILGTPLAIAYLLWRSRRQPEYRRHWGERFGLHPRREGERPLIWVHAVSVGETRAAQPLVEALLARWPGHDLLLTHMTPTGRETGAQLFAKKWAGRVRQAYLPYDYPFAVRAFLRAWRPSVGILMETELWPNLAAVARGEGVRLALVNARLSERSLRRGLRWGALIRDAAAALDLVVAQTQADADRIARLGRGDAIVAGNLKFDVDPPPAMEALGHAWRRALLARPQPGALARLCVLAASTRDGEEALLLDAWRERLQPPSVASALKPLLVVVPRHPQRFDEVADAIRARGLRVLRRSELGEGATIPGPSGATAGAGRAPAGRDPAPAFDVLLGDSMGEMFAYYALADVAIVGGSLLPFGGQNPIEPLAVGVPVVVGPHTFNFAQVTDDAIAADAAARAADAAEAVDVALRILFDGVGRQTMSDRAVAFTAAHRGATARTVAALEGLIGAGGA